jgi:hypothetical protein
VEGRDRLPVLALLLETSRPGATLEPSRPLAVAACASGAHVQKYAPLRFSAACAIGSSLPGGQSVGLMQWNQWPIGQKPVETFGPGAADGCWTVLELSAWIRTDWLSVAVGHTFGGN